MANPINDQDAFFMREAIKEAETAAARGDYGIGAVVVHNDQIISRAGNQIITRGNRQFAHAEFLAFDQLRDTEYLVAPNTREIRVYTTLGPCPQCWGFMLVNGIGRIVYGAGDRISTQDYNTSVPEIFKTTAPAIFEMGGDLGEICNEIFSKSRVEIDNRLGYSSK